ncbi:hypothetical protein RDWZM_007213, partial [Blomia tropicalis]
CPVRRGSIRETIETINVPSVGLLTTIRGWRARSSHDHPKQLVVLRPNRPFGACGY